MDPHAFRRTTIAKSDVSFTLANDLREVYVPGRRGITEIVGQVPCNEVIRMDLNQANQVLRTGNRQWPEQYRVDQAEHRCVGADSDGEQQRCGYRKDGALRQQPNAEAEVAKEIEQFPFRL